MVCRTGWYWCIPNVLYCSGTELLCNTYTECQYAKAAPYHTYLQYTSGTKMANRAKVAFPHEKIKGEQNEEKKKEDFV